MATFLIERQLTLPGIQTESAFYAQMQREKKITEQIVALILAQNEAEMQRQFEDSMPLYHLELEAPMFGAQEGQHTNGVCEYVLIWSDGEDSRWAMTPSENPYL